jgi:iron complex outermembrane receptor protein
VPDDCLTLQGDVFTGWAGRKFLVSVIGLPPYTRLFDDRLQLNGGHLRAEWQRQFADESELTLAVYGEHTQQTMDIVRECRDTGSVEFQHQLHLAGRHTVVWGGNYRVSADATKGSATLSFMPADATTWSVGGFVQDQVALTEKLQFTLGTKLECNNYSGWEVQPSARWSWTPTPRQTWWGAVSRAVRTPSRTDAGIRFEQELVAPGIVPVIYGSPDFVAEKLVAGEMGWRTQLASWFTSDVAVFYNWYDDVRSAERTGFDGSTTPPQLVIVEDNRLRGATFGLEWVGRWQVAPWWRLEGQYSWLTTRIRLAGNSTDNAGERNAPGHQVALHSQMDLPGHWELDGVLRWVGAVATGEIQPYWDLDVRVAWHPTPRFELAVVGQNLVAARREEFPSLFTIQRSAVERGVYGKVTWRF